jgi:PAS domain S-box-containing protein
MPSRTTHRYNFGTLANQIRLDILRALRGGEKNVTELCRTLRFNQSTVSHNLKRLISSGFVRMRQDGSFRVYSLNAPVVVPFLDHMEATVRSRGKAMEKALKESEDRFRKLLDVTPWIVAVYSDGKVDFINEAGAKALGAKNASEVIGMPVSAFIPPEQFGDLAEGLKDVEEGKMTAPHDSEIVGADGKRRTIESASAPIVFDGRAALVTVARDKTEEERLTRTARVHHDRQQALTSAIVSAMPEIYRILRFDRQGRCIDCRSGEQSVRDLEEGGATLADFVPPSMAAAMLAKGPSLAPGASLAFRHEVSFPLGSLFYDVHLTMCPHQEVFAVIKNVPGGRSPAP